MHAPIFLSHYYRTILLSHCYRTILLPYCYLITLLSFCYLIILLSYCYLITLLSHCYLITLLSHCYLITLLSHCYLTTLLLSHCNLITLLSYCYLIILLSYCYLISLLSHCCLITLLSHCYLKLEKFKLSYVRVFYMLSLTEIIIVLFGWLTYDVYFYVFMKKNVKKRQTSQNPYCMSWEYKCQPIMQTKCKICIFLFLLRKRCFYYIFCIAARVYNVTDYSCHTTILECIYDAVL